MTATDFLSGIRTQDFKKFPPIKPLCYSHPYLINLQEVLYLHAIGQPHIPPRVHGIWQHFLNILRDNSRVEMIAINLAVLSKGRVILILHNPQFIDILELLGVVELLDIIFDASVARLNDVSW